MSAPRPWQVHNERTPLSPHHAPETGRVEVRDADGVLLATVYDREAAALLLRAVNAYRDLVGALTTMTVALPQHDEGNCHPETEERTGAACCFYREARRTAEAALLLAEARL